MVIDDFILKDGIILLDGCHVDYKAILNTKLTSFKGRHGSLKFDTSLASMFHDKEGCKGSLAISIVRIQDLYAQ